MRAPALDPGAPRATPARRVAGLLLGAAAVAGWVTIGRSVRGPRFFVVLGAFAVGLVACAFAIDGAELRARLRPRPGSVLVGIAGGLVMAGVTHALYALASGLLPELIEPVSLLYAQIRAAPAASIAVPLVGIIIFAEEVVWRGVVLDAAGGGARGVTFSVLGYTLSQAGAPTPLLGLVALCCGLAWSLERLWRRDLVAPLLTHLLWDLLILSLLPLERPR